MAAMTILDGDLSLLLTKQSRHWLVTGSAGFIGSHLLETLLRHGQIVTSLDNFSTGHPHNLYQVRNLVGEHAWRNHHFIQGDITDLATCQMACKEVDMVLHQAALGSVPRSINSPLDSHHVNATGFLNMLVAARDAGVKRFIYAASSSTYGDSTALPKLEDTIGNPLSPYAVTKYVNELYSQVFHRCYDLDTVGLRYFNVFGPRQDPNGAYAAVIPRWIAAILRKDACTINGNGETSRDFCFVANAVQANLRAALMTLPNEKAQVYNIATGNRTTLLELHTLITQIFRDQQIDIEVIPPNFASFRAGDVRHSLASISKAQTYLGYQPTHSVTAGLIETIKWYAKNQIQ